MCRLANEHRSGTALRQKRTFSLSADSIKYIKRLAKNHRSVSPALDHLIHERMMESEREQISAGIRSITIPLTMLSGRRTGVGVNSQNLNFHSNKSDAFASHNTARR